MEFLCEMDLNKGSGIYAIVNLINDHCYVGSTTNFHTRKLTHLSRLRKNKRPSIRLQEAYNTYGENNLIFGVLEAVVGSENLQSAEQRWVDKLRPEYNYDTKIVRYKFSKLRNKKISTTLKRVAKRGKENPLHGVKRDRDVVDRIFKTRALLGKDKIYGKTSHSVLQYDERGNFISEYMSVNDAFKATKIHRDKISGLCRGDYPYKNNTGYIFKYKKDNGLDR
jgi:group I intron endonuclease